MSLGLGVGIVEGNEREDLLEALKKLCSFDADFSGDNGIEYNWDETIDGGFYSNAEYCLDKVKDLENDEDVIDEFINMWIKNNPDYVDYEIDISYDDNGKIKCIAIATASS